MGNLASAVDELLAVDVHELPDAALGDEIAEVRRQINRLEAAYLTRLEAFDRRGGALAEHGSTAAWLRSSLHLSPGTASRDVHLSRDLADALPATKAALGDGDIAVPHAHLIASLRRDLGDATVTKVEPHLLDIAREATPRELRSAVTHVRHTCAPDRVLADEQDDYAHRRLHTSTTFDGLGVGDWLLHPIGQETVATALHALSRPVAGDDRTPAQRRADALVTMAEIALRSGELPITGGVKPHVTVIVHAETLAGGDQAPAADYAFGAVTSGERARRVACDASLARVVFGPDSEILAAGRATRSFKPAQVRSIVARDRHCIWPGCDAPPGWCDAHHRRHWARGGNTDTDNGVLLCGRHHDRVHVNGHAVRRVGGGRFMVDLRPASDPDWTGPRHRAGP